VNKSEKKWTYVEYPLTVYRYMKGFLCTFISGSKDLFFLTWKCSNIIFYNFIHTFRASYANRDITEKTILDS